ncbi:hypothetical protein K474DRAFT_1275818 [Panus rudis PR-1116 ss-1]|nr:hypothetical protein K474DRAFT_1275818 [Panus rudis PR-1116 ss-1]
MRSSESAQSCRAKKEQKRNKKGDETKKEARVFLFSISFFSPFSAPFLLLFLVPQGRKRRTLNDPIDFEATASLVGLRVVHTAKTLPSSCIPISRPTVDPD